MRRAKKVPARADRSAGSDAHVACFWSATGTVAAQDAFYDIFDASNPVCRLCQRCVVSVQPLASHDADLRATLARRLPPPVRAELLRLPA